MSLDAKLTQVEEWREIAKAGENRIQRRAAVRKLIKATDHEMAIISELATNSLFSIFLYSNDSVIQNDALQALKKIVPDFERYSLKINLQAVRLLLEGETMPLLSMIGNLAPQLLHVFAVLLRESGYHFDADALPEYTVHVGAEILTAIHDKVDNETMQTSIIKGVQITQDFELGHRPTSLVASGERVIGSINQSGFTPNPEFKKPD